jgi:hypothetical protein
MSNKPPDDKDSLVEMLKKLGLERPKDSAEEFNTWYTLNELIVLGGHSLNFKKLNYRDEE